MDRDDILEVLKNGDPIMWKFQMDKKGFDASSGTMKAMPDAKVTACKSPLERAEKCKTKQFLSNIIWVAVNNSIASNMGIANIAWKSVTLSWPVTRF
eukprot:11531937-Ditylum_brightwellii.AAC.1